MKKKELIEIIAERLTVLGYHPLPGPIDAGLTVFAKSLQDVKLMFLLEFSKTYKERFTGSFQLSLCYAYCYMPGDYPPSAYKRIGHFLKRGERKMLIPEFQEKDVIDAWWSGFNQSGIDSFINAIMVTEPRFVAQENLLQSIVSSHDLKKHIQILEAIQMRTKRMKKKPSGLSGQPKYKEPVSENWYWAAEEILRERGYNVKPKAVEFFTLDAWRLATMNK